MREIEFHRSPRAEGDIPAPYPATSHAPDWFKAMPADFNNFTTMKRCGPFVEAMTAGYIIPAPADARIFNCDDNVIRLQFFAQKYIEVHHPNEYAGAPFQGLTMIKFANPWLIKTDPDVVCFVTAPINRFQLPLLPISGIVETGSFYKEVALPMISMLERGRSCLLRRGAPMIHVIPFRRDEWSSRVGEADAALFQNHGERFAANPHFYKDELWKKLHFA